LSLGGGVIPLVDGLGWLSANNPKQIKLWSAFRRSPAFYGGILFARFARLVINLSLQTASDIQIADDWRAAENIASA